MIEDKDMAKKLNEVLLEVSGSLNDSIFLAMEGCSEEEVKAYKHAVACVMAELGFKIFFPLWNKYPDIAPDGFWDDKDQKPT